MGVPDQQPGIRLRVLGTARLERDGEPVHISSARQRKILAVLAAAGGRPVAGDVVIDALWRDLLPVHPSAALQTQLTRVRRLLGPSAGALRGDSAGYRLALERAEVDAWQFEDTVAGGRDVQPSVGALRAALSLWRGEPFADSADHPAVQPAAARLLELRGRAMEELAGAHLAAGDADAALGVVDALLLDDPFREPARALQARALCRAGRTTEALHRYDEYRRRLAEELGLDPPPLLQQLERDILEHHLPFRPSKPSVGGDLPALPVSSFVGRERELEAVLDLVDRARIVTIVGPGGSGKTRLAIHAAHALRAGYPDGVWWCDLVATAPGEVATAVAARLGVQERPGEATAERLAAVIGERRVLLVLDNCEHVTDEARALVDGLVRPGPALDVLATSRQSLAVDGEHQLRLGPLACTDRDDDLPSPALTLFLERARAAAPGFEPRGDRRSAAVELCRKTGGLPLAIELAAACVGRIDLRTLADRITDHLAILDRAGPSDRHHSLTNVIDSSYELLDRDEQQLVDRLSVFAGPFTLEDAEALDRRSGSARSVGRSLGGLVDKSVVLFHPAGGHYELLPPVQAVCRSHLAAAGDRDRWQAHHAELVLERAARTDRALRTRDEPKFSDMFDRSVAEMRAARTWLVGTGDIGALCELSASTHFFALLRMRSEFYRWADDVVARAAGGDEFAGLGRARACAANGAAKAGDLARARVLASATSGIPPGETRYCTEILAQVELSTAGSRTRSRCHAPRRNSTPQQATRSLR